MENYKDILTIAGLVFGLIAGWIIGSKDIYRRMNKANLIKNDYYNDPSNQLDSNTRFVLFFVGGLFALIGIGLIVAAVMGVSDEEISATGLGIFGLIFAGIGGLVCVPAITGKQAS